jgi:hypothetical protein
MTTEQTAKRYRVHYHLHAAGGRLWPTWRKIEATSPWEAVRIAEDQQRSSDHRRGRAYTGYFRDAYAVPVDPNPDDLYLSEVDPEEENR